jgi:hypothetical protein
VGGGGGGAASTGMLRTPFSPMLHELDPFGVPVL